jgi:hypothetical protein
MAACTECGKKAGFRETVCVDCDRRLRQEAAELAEKRRIEEAESFAAEVQAKLGDWRSFAKGQLASGQGLQMYSSIYVEVDSLSDGNQLGIFSLAPLQAAGLQGWKVIAVVPRTAGIGLVNKETQGFNTSTVWGGGMGGNVLGVYLILEKPITALNTPMGEWAQELAQELIEDGYQL